MNRARQMNQSRANLLKSAKTIDTKQINNLLTGENLSLFKNSLELFKVESADAHCVSLGFLRLDVKVETHIFFQRYLLYAWKRNLQQCQGVLNF